MIAELDISRRLVRSACLLEEIAHTSAAGLIIVNLVSPVLIGTFCSISVFRKFHCAVCTINYNFLDIRLISCLIILFILFLSLLPGFRFFLHHFIKISVFKVWVYRLPVPSPVFKAPILYVAVSKMGISVVMSLLILHSRHRLFRLDRIFQYIEKVNDLHVLIDRFL